MKKAGIFAAVIAVVLLFMQFYNYRLAGYTEDAMFVIDGVEAANILKNGVKEDQSGDMVLKTYEKGTPLYSRGDKRFVGQDYEPLNLSYPVYVNEGAYLYNYSDEMELIASDFTRLNTYDGLYVADGRTYNRDREQADPDEFLFAETPDGLFLNVQEMTIQSGAQEQVLPVNSFLNPEISQISWYQLEKGGVYRYKTYQDLMQAEVTIGSVTMPYSNLVELLTGEDGVEGIEIESPEIPMSPLPKTDLETEPETLPEIPETLPAEDSQEEESGLIVIEGEAVAGTGTMGAAPETGAQTGAEEEGATETGAENSAAASPEAGTETVPAGPQELPTHPPIPGDRDGWDFPSGDDAFGDEGGEEGGQGEGGENTPGGGEEGGQGGDTPGGGEEGGDTPGGGEGEEGGQGGEGEGGGEEGEGGTGEPEFAAPKVEVKNFDFSVYSATAELTIEDPSMSIIKGVRLVFYKEGEARASYRKMYYGQGPITIQPLEPDTRYEVEGYFDYMHPDYGKTREFFQEKTYCGKTLPISALGEMVVDQQTDGAVLLPYAIQIKDFSVKNASDVASPANVKSGINATDYISSVQMRFEKKGVPDWNGPETALSSALTSQLKRGETIAWRTAEILDSSSSYNYHIAIYDRYGNELPVSEKAGTGPDGEARTCKQTPTAKLTVDRKSTVDRMAVNVAITNPDKVEYTEKPYLYVTYADMPDAAIPFTLEGEEEEQTRYYLEDKKEADLVFTSFLPSTVYTIWVRGSYDLEDGKLHERELMGQISTTTDALTSLGTVNFTYKVENLTYQSAAVTSRMRNPVPDSLYPFVSRLDMTMKKAGEEENCFAYSFEREELERIMVQPGVPYTLYEPEPSAQIPTHDPVITVTLPAEASEERSLWDTLLTTGTAAFTFGEHGLASATDYQISTRAYAVRGDSQGAVTEDVTGRYYQTDYKTLKKPAEIEHQMSFVNGSSATFYQLRVIDPDGAVLEGNITIRLRNASNNALLEVRTTTVAELNQTDSIKFTGLEENTQYKVEVVAAEYNEGYTSATKKLQKLLGEIVFRSVNTLQGTMTMDSMSNGYDPQSPEEGFGLDSRNLFEVNQATVNYALDSTTGTGINPNTSCMVSDYIEVEPGTVYAVGGGAGISVSKYGADKKYLGSQNMTQVNTYNYYRPDEKVKYVRIGMEYKHSASAFMSKVLFTEPDSEANLIRRYDVEFKDGLCLEHDGRVIQSGNAAYTSRIPVDGGAVYLRLDADKGEANWTSNRIVWYDAEGNVLSTVIGNATMGLVTAPKNAAYAALNLNKDYKDKLYFARRPDTHYSSKNLVDKNSPDVTWVSGMYVNSVNRYDKQTVSYAKYCEYVPVSPSTVYYTEALQGMQIFDAEKNFLGYLDISNYTYFQTPQEAAYIRANCNFGTGNTANPVVRKASISWNTDSVNLGFQVTLSDPDKSLGEAPVFTLEYKKTDSNGSELTWKNEYRVDADSRQFDKIVYIENAEPGCQYEVNQVVELGGNRIVLSTLVMSTGSKVRVIKSEAALRAARYAPMDDFVVTEDIEMTTTSNVLGNFYGHLDFQGHTLTMVDKSCLVQYLRSSGVVENLVMDIRRTENAARLKDNIGLVIQHNSGTLRNVVLNLTVDNQLDNIAFGGLAYYNYANALIDGFAIHLHGNLYARRQFGLAAYSNAGCIKNGYMVSGEGSVITLNTDSIAENEQTQNWEYRSALVGTSSGTVENLYSVAVVDSPAPLNSSNACNYNALGVGYVDQGTVQNVFSVGMLLKNGVPTTVGPTVANRRNNNSTKNISYVATQPLENESYYGNAINNGVLATSLWDQVWMDTAVNGEDRFNTAMVLDGFYPQVKMPSCMDGAQPVVQLPAREAAPVKLLSNQVLEQGEDSAKVRFFFDNRNRLQIKELEIATLKISSENIRQYQVAADTEILEQGVGADGIYYADVRVFNPTIFRSQYFVNKFSVGMAGSDTSYPVEENSREKQEVGLEFYQPITSLPEWREKLHTNLDLYGNYRLKAEELDFSGIGSADMSSYRITGSFYGNITGQWTDEDGNLRTTVLKNISLEGANCWLIQNLYGTFSHVKVENLSINIKEGTAASAGLINSILGGYVDHIEITGADVRCRQRAGVLAAYLAQAGKITNCSVSDSTMKSLNTGHTDFLEMGGLVGYIENSYGQILNSFVRNLHMDNRDAFDNNGVGGLVGFMQNGLIENCYAVGTIDTEYRNVGGLVGKIQNATTQIRHCYAKMDMDSYGKYLGGLVGYSVPTTLDSFRNNLALGDLFVHSNSMGNINRIVGYPSGNRTHAQNYGFESQMFNNQIDPSNPGDAEAVLTAADLGNRDTWLRLLDLDTDTYALSWELDGKTQSVADGYLPLLKSTEGELLPGQEAVSYGQSQLKLENVEIADNGQAGNMCYDWFGHRNIESAFDLRFQLTYDREKYQVAQENGQPQIALKGMNLNTRVYSNKTQQMEDGYKVYPSEDQTSEQWVFPFVQTQMGGDMYRLTVVLESKADPDLKITLSAVVQPKDGSSTFYINNATEWQKAMAQHGQSYANFVLTGDIHLETISQNELITNLKINRLTSQGGPWTISGVNMEVTGASGGFISSCLSGISNVNFKDCSVTVAADKMKTVKHNRIGLIGTNMGVIQNVNFTDITLQGGYGLYTGCIAYNLGTVTDITAEGTGENGKMMKVSGDESVGAVVGYSASTLQRITAKGKLSPAADGDGYDSTYLVEGRWRTGGIVGSGNLTDKTSATGLKVVGTNAYTYPTVNDIQQIGGAIGNGSFTAPSETVDEKMEKSTKVADCYVTMEDAHKAGSHRYLGGATGYTGDSRYLQVENVLVDSDIAVHAGGAAGFGVLYRCVVRSVDADADENGYTIPDTKVFCKSQAGGAIGLGGIQDYSVVEKVTVEAAGSYAGGAVGQMNGGYQLSDTLVDQVTVKASTGAGGFVGIMNTGNFINNLVSRCTVTSTGAYAGGLAGRAGSANYAGQIYQNGVLKTTVTAGEDPDTRASYAGGLVGDLGEAYRHYRNYVRETTITGSGDYVGGLFGRALGGHYYGNVIDEKSSVTGRNFVGGMFGGLQGRKKEEDKVLPSYKEMKIYESYSAVPVKGEDFVGGLIGGYTTGPLDANKPEDGLWLPKPESLYGVLMMGSVVASGDGGAGGSGAAGSGAVHENLILNMVPDDTGVTQPWSGKSLRIYEGSTLNGQAASEVDPNMKRLADYKPAVLGGTVPNDSAEADVLQSTLLVSSEELMDKRIYTENKYELGGMNWASTWRYQGLGRMDELPEGTEKRESDLGVTITYPDGTTKDFPEGTTDVIVIDMNAVTNENVAKAIMPEQPNYAWFRLYVPNTQLNTGNLVSTGITTQELPLAGRGYYVGRSDVGGNWNYTPIIKVESDGYMPQLNSGTGWMKGGQEGLPQNILDGDPLWKWQRVDENHTTAEVLNMGYQSDNLYYGGTVIPKGNSGSGANLSLQGDAPVTVYPSGASTINVELAADYETLSNLTVESDGQTLLKGKPAQRVYTLDYDYRSPVKVTLTAAVAEDSGEISSGADGEGSSGVAGDAGEAATVTEFTRTVTVDSSALRRTVMVYGSEYYYTCGGKLMDSTGVAVDDEIIHLYGGQALSMDGVVYDLAADREVAGAASRSVSEDADVTGAAASDRAASGAAAGESDRAASAPIPFWEDGELRAFGEFTEVAADSEGTPMIQEQQLVRKDGELYALTGGQSLKGMVLDTYNGETYASFLNEDGKLKDAADALHTPENFNRNGIAHMSSSLDADVPYVLVRYANGAAKGFDYTTGEELPIENAFSDLSILDFAGDFLGQFMGTTGNGSLEFVDLKELEDKLILSPIPDGLLEGGSNRLDKTEVPKGETQMPDPDKDGSAEDGGSNEENGGSGGVNDGSGNTVDGEDGAVGGSEGGEESEAAGAEDSAGADADGSEGGQDAEADGDENAEANDGEGGENAGAEADADDGEDGQDAEAEGGENAGAEADEEAASSENAGADADGEENISSAALKDDLGGSQSGQPSDILDGQSGDRAENGQSGPALSGQPGDSTADGTVAGNGDSTADGQAAGNGSSTADGSAAGDGSESGTAEGSVEGTGEADAEGTADGQGKAAGSQSGDGAAGQADRQSGDSSSESGAEAGHSGDASAEADADKASSKNSASKDPARPAARSAAYTYAFNTKDGSSRLYNTSDLLTKTGSDLMDEEEKLELLKASGVVTEDYIVAPTTNESQSRTGAAIFAITAAAALGLTGLLIRRKRKYD